MGHRHTPSSSRILRPSETDIRECRNLYSVHWTGLPTSNAELHSLLTEPIHIDIQLSVNVMQQASPLHIQPNAFIPDSRDYPVSFVEEGQCVREGAIFRAFELVHSTLLKGCTRPQSGMTARSRGTWTSNLVWFVCPSTCLNT